MPMPKPQLNPLANRCPLHHVLEDTLCKLLQNVSKIAYAYTYVTFTVRISFS